MLPFTSDTYGSVTIKIVKPVLRSSPLFLCSKYRAEKEVYSNMGQPRHKRK